MILYTCILWISFFTGFSYYTIIIMTKCFILPRLTKLCVGVISRISRSFLGLLIQFYQYHSLLILKKYLYYTFIILITLEPLKQQHYQDTVTLVGNIRTPPGWQAVSVANHYILWEYEAKNIFYIISIISIYEFNSSLTVH